MPRKTTGLGWANRAVSAKPPKVRIIDEELVRLADDLWSAIRNANFPLRGQTLHMNDAVANYLEWKRVNNV